jgi:hypothetical protein
MIKWVYSFTVLAATIGWGVYTLEAIINSVDTPSAREAMGASGASFLMGALIVWNGNINQYWFRKKGPEDKPKGGE